MKFFFFIEFLAVLMLIIGAVMFHMSWQDGLLNVFTGNFFNNISDNISQTIGTVLQPQFNPPAAGSLNSTDNQKQAPLHAIHNLGSWQFNIGKVDWTGDSVYLLISIKNTSGKSLVFGEENDSFRLKPFQLNRLCVVDSKYRVYAETDKRIYESGFYDRTYQAGEEYSGTMKFVLSPEADDVYLYLYRDNIAVEQLFHLGYVR